MNTRIKNTFYGSRRHWTLWINFLIYASCLIFSLLRQRRSLGAQSIIDEFITMTSYILNTSPMVWIYHRFIMLYFVGSVEYCLICQKSILSPNVSWFHKTFFHWLFDWMRETSYCGFKCNENYWNNINISFELVKLHIDDELSMLNWIKCLARFPLFLPLMEIKHCLYIWINFNWTFIYYKFHKMSIMIALILIYEQSWLKLTWYDLTF